MTYIFIIMQNDRISVFERLSNFKFKPIPIHCELDYQVLDEQYKLLGETIYQEVIDHLNLKDCAFIKLLILYQQVKLEHLIDFIHAFQEARSCQLMNIANILNFIAIQKGLYKELPTDRNKEGKELYMRYELVNYKLTYNTHNYFDVQVVTKHANTHVSTNELLNYSNVLAAL